MPQVIEVSQKCTPEQMEFMVEVANFLQKDLYLYNEQGKNIVIPNDSLSGLHLHIFAVTGYYGTPRCETHLLNNWGLSDDRITKLVGIDGMGFSQSLGNHYLTPYDIFTLPFNIWYLCFLKVFSERLHVLKDFLVSIQSQLALTSLSEMSVRSLNAAKIKNQQLKATTEQEIATYYQRISEKMTNLRSLNQIQFQEAVTKNFDGMFDKLPVKSIRFNLNTQQIVVITRQIIAPFKFGTAVLAPIKIIIKLNSSGEIVMVQHQTNHNQMHPHYSSYACWGGFGESILKTMNDFDLPLLIGYLIEWTTAINPSDALCSLQNCFFLSGIVFNYNEMISGEHSTTNPDYEETEAVVEDIANFATTVDEIEDENEDRF